VSSSIEIAQRLVDAYGTLKPIEPVRGEITGVAAAYAVQRASVDIWRGHGRRVAGQKIGLTAEAVQQQLGVAEPDFGTLFADMILPDGATVGREAVLQPRVEAETAFVLKSDLRGDRITPEQVVEATDYICPALEICGSRIARWDIRIEDTIADNASSGLVVIGSTRAKPDLRLLAEIAMRLRHNGAAAGEGKGSACLGNPAMAVAWLAEALTSFGDGLRAGDLVMSGALSRMLPAAPGDNFAADFGALGQVSARFAA
jgi:2-keto-4-pentenoate hydratase